MTWTGIVWVLLYFAIGWLLMELCECDEDSTAFTIFMAWPAIIGLLVISSATLILLGIIKSLFEIFDKKD